MNKFTLSLLTIALWGCVSTAQAADEMSPQDLQAIEALQKRADKLAFGEVGSDNYYLAKARTWLDMALSEYHQKDTTGLILASTAEAKKLIEALENKETNISNETQRSMAGTEVVRQDLWDKIAAMKGNAKSCVSSKLAEAEVYLVWTGHEKMESGWTHGESYARAAENLIYEAQVSVTNCLAAAAIPVAKNVEKLSLSGDATFVFGTNNLTDGAEAKLDKLAEGIKGWTQLQSVELIGHTDRLRSDGNEKKNQELSERRAEAIKQYLVGKGIAGDKIKTVGAGSTKPIVKCDSKMNRATQVACLQPNRRVEIILRGEK
ncbi:MAG: hypothetical protein C0406_06545 [Sideroxydans sp.]|nr:hypothetical protein [Sideroxydans sp.]